MYRSILAGLCVVGLTGAVRAGAEDFFTEKDVNFGTTPRGPVLFHYFAVKNTSNQPVTIGQPRVSCGCTSASVLKSQLAPGESTSVVAYMDTRRIPQANVLKTVIVYVPFYTPQPEEVQLQVHAVARDDLVMSPEVLGFGTVRKGQGGKATTKVTLYSDPSWKVTEATSSGAYVKAEVKEAQRQGNEVSYEVTATLDPNCPVGDWTADVWLKTTGAGVEKLRIPVRVTVVAPIAVNPNDVQFGQVHVGEPAEQKVILQGTQPFKVVKVKGAEDGEVKVDQVGEGSRPVHILKVTFTPKAAGDWSRSLEIDTDSKEQPKVVVPLHAKATK